MGENQAVPADAGVVADHDGLGGIDVRELQDDRAAAEHELRFRQLWPTDIDLLANLRVLANLDHVTRQIAERPDTRVASNADRFTLDDGEKTDLDMIAQLDALPDHHTAEADLHAPADPVAEEQAIGEDLQRAREPTKQDEVPPRDARLGEECFGHWGRNVRFNAP